MRLAVEEPEARPWRAERLAVIARAITGHAAAAGAGRPVVLAIDGRSSSGKSTLAARIADLAAGSVIVHTDDIAWRHSRFGWADLLIEGILRPVRNTGTVTFRPPRWEEHGRDGSVAVPAGCPLLVIEGVGSGRRETAGLTDTLIWVQADERVTWRRSLARVGTPAGPQSTARLRDWMAEEVPFTAGQRTWERADLIVCGTPDIPHDPATEVVISASQSRWSPGHPGQAGLGRWGDLATTTRNIGPTTTRATEPPRATGPPGHHHPGHRAARHHHPCHGSHPGHPRDPGA